MIRSWKTVLAAAALLEAGDVHGMRVGVILSGGNVDLTQVAAWQRAAIAELPRTVHRALAEARRARDARDVDHCVDPAPLGEVGGPANEEHCRRDMHPSEQEGYKDENVKKEGKH